MKSIGIMAAVVFAAALGCEDPPAAPPPAMSAKPTTMASAAPSAMASAKPTASAKADADADKGKMANCPNAVAGAKTEIKDTKDGVEIMVTAKDEAVTKEIRERSKHAMEAAKKEAASVKHTGEGTGGGALGRCPVVLKNTTVEVADMEGGSKITVKPKDAKEADWLRRETKERNSELATPGTLDAGQGKMAHCPSAVEGSKTEIKETKDAVEVTVTAKDAAMVKDIQTRGKYLVEAAKNDPTDVKHSGDGKGGGGFGRCPVVVKDTTVEMKETASGAMFTVKPKKAADLDWLKKESKERHSKVEPDGKVDPAASGTPAVTAAPATTAAPKK